MRPLFYIFASIVFFFFVMFVYIKLAGPIPFSVNSVTTTKSDAFTVTGEGKSSITPNQATVSVGVQAKGDSAEQVKNQMNLTINKVTDAIKALGIDSKDIQTSNFNVSPSYDYPAGVQKINGYMASTNLTVKVHEISKANQVLDTAIANGATQAGGVQLDNSDQTQAESEARTQAIANAKKKAEATAKAAGFRLGKLINYSEGGSPIRPYALDKAVNSSAGSAPTQIEPGQNEITVTVNLSYEIN